jgi:glycosyltransferase involved in cell wall biosynthesis
LSSRKENWALLYDSDGGNPYGKELAALLNPVIRVKSLMPVDTGWEPATISVDRILPSNRPSFKLAQIFRMLRGVAVIAQAGLIGRATILQVMTKGWYDELSLALVAILGARVVAFAHDPIPKWKISRLRRFSRKMLFKYATVLLAHSEALATQAGVVAGRACKVAPHLPFVEYAAWAKAVAPDTSSPGKHRLLLLGRMDPDKGLDRLPAIFGLIPENKRNRISVAFAGKGSCDEVIAKMAQLVDVTRKPSDRLLSDIEVAQELAKSDVLIAPYRLVTGSATVVLALSRGLNVIAYDAGALAEIVNADGLVRHGDEAGFAERICAVINGRCGGPARSIDAWRQATLEAWLEAIRGSSLVTDHAVGRRAASST